MADTGLFAWLCRASICGDADVERAAEIMKYYYQGVGPEPEYQERELMSPNEASALLDSFAVATPPSPSTAPEVPPFPESFGLADVPHAMNTPDDWDADYRATWQKLQVAEINLSQMRAYARKLRAALASRPAEVDDEGLPPLPLDTAAWMLGQNLYHSYDVIPGNRLPPRGNPVQLFTAEQYRQGQRDAVAADRARREKGTEQ